MTGYIIIDCAGIDMLSEDSQSLTGLYARVQEAINTGKPIYATNLTWGEQGTMSPVEIFTVQFDGYVVCTASTIQIIVGADDSVTINNLIQQTSAKTTRKGKSE